MNNSHSSSGPTWRSSRTRDRNKARFLIRSHVAAECEEGREEECGRLLPESELLLVQQASYGDNIDAEIISNVFKAASDGNTSHFSLKCIADHYKLILLPQSHEYLSLYKVTTLCTSRFGEEYTKAALYYIQHIRYFTLMEYASIIGEYGIVTSLIKGGINPLPVESLLRVSNYENVSATRHRREQEVSKLVLRKLVANIHLPKTLAVYMIKSIFVMKMWSFYLGNQNGNNDLPSEQRQVCPICQHEELPFITFPGICNHSCCELCHWNVAATKLHDRQEGDVFQCPVCCQPSSSSDATLHHNAGDGCGDNGEDEYCDKDPSQRCQFSLEKFLDLPENGKELRRVKRPSKKKNKIYSSWTAALEASCGQSKDVRRDKFMRYVNTGATHHCRACLRAGVDVNDTNEFNQNALYIATWRNHFEIVKLLLEWGADPTVVANGNLSLWNVAMAHGYHDILGLFQQWGIRGMGYPLLKSRIQSKIDKNSPIQEVDEYSTVTYLISQSADHPGAGSCYIDNAVPEAFLQFLEELHLDTPVADDCDIKKKKKNRVCSLRHNFCDSENAVCGTLTTCIEKALSKSSMTFPAMRFLHYDTPGSVLPPHVDLTKVDVITQKRSTHTFILYLHDCEHGGETALLKELSPDGPSAHHEVVAQVKPKRGRLLLFPHICPHEGKEVISTPKLLLRGEVMMEEKYEIDIPRL
mmetsp:Transcript_3391/g.6342  ORF Transcript_3391/g.6342 Transcript_3391/m.6342 type:complete len:697 (+) Transcript_3391:2195-4285(+)